MKACTKTVEQQGKILDKESFEVFCTFWGKFWVFPTTTNPDFLPRSFRCNIFKFPFNPIEKKGDGKGKKILFFFFCHLFIKNNVPNRSTLLFKFERKQERLQGTSAIVTHGGQILVRSFGNFTSINFVAFFAQDKAQWLG